MVSLIKSYVSVFVNAINMTHFNQLVLSHSPHTQSDPVDNFVE